MLKYMMFGLVVMTAPCIGMDKKADEHTEKQVPTSWDPCHPKKCIQNVVVNVAAANICNKVVDLSLRDMKMRKWELMPLYEEKRRK